MFTGIIETIGTIEKIAKEGSGCIFWVSSTIVSELRLDQSIAHNGICLTIDRLENNCSRVTAIAETLQKTNAGSWNPGSKINLERCLQINARLDGHIVQGHVDCIATCIKKTEFNGSWEFRFRFPEKFAALVIEKGSISINGTSLTIFDVTRNEFTVAIIPYTYTHTTFFMVSEGDTVNIEFDLIGKYILRIAELKEKI